MLSLTSRYAARAAAALALLACLGALDVQGRQAAPRSSDQMLRERQRMIYKRALEDELRRPRTREEQRLAVEQIKDDYVRIQVVSRELTLMANEGGELDLKLVAKSAAEIRKRAERLKSNLALPEAGEGADGARAAGEKREGLKASLTTLGELVRRFVRNPIFREINVVDAQASARARLELEEIIELSGRLKKDCERSDRDSRQSP